VKNVVKAIVAAGGEALCSFGGIKKENLRIYQLL
jgi:hypothetical protein